MNNRAIRLWAKAFIAIICLGLMPLVAQVAPAAASLRAGALSFSELDLVGLSLTLPATATQIPQDAPFFLPVTLNMGGQALTASQASAYCSPSAKLTGTLTGPGLPAPVPVSGNLASGLNLPGLPQEGAYTLSGVALSDGGQTLYSATPATYPLTCLGEILLTSVTSTPMTMQQIQNAGIQLQPGDYQGRSFEMVLGVGSNQISLSVPVAIPIYNGLVNPTGDGAVVGTLKMSSLNGMSLPNLSVVMANLTPPSDPFSLSRPALSFQLHNNFKGILVIPGSIGYLKQIYKVNVVVFNALPSGSPYRVTHLSATWQPPTGLDGVVGTADDPLLPAAGEALTQAMLTQDGGSSSIGAGESALATFHPIGNREGSQPLDFLIAGQFEGGDLRDPVAISGVAHGKVLIQDPTFSLLLVHPDVVRCGQSYTLEAHLTNTSQTLANAVSITIDKARLGGVQLLSDATQQVDTLLPGQTVVMSFQLQSFISGQITSSYLTIDPGASINFQLSTAVGPCQVALNPDTLSLPDSLGGLPGPLKDAMVAALSAAYDVATAQSALPPGVLPIDRGTITTTMANNLSQEGLFIGMGLDPVRVWWDLWTMFTLNPDPGFNRVMRTTQVGADLRNALLAAWSWADPQAGPDSKIQAMAQFNSGLGGVALLGVQGAGPGLTLTLSGGGAGLLQNQDPIQGLPAAGQAAGASGALLLAQYPMLAAETVQAVLANTGSSDLSLSLGLVNPSAGQGASVANTLAFTLPAGASATLVLGPTQAVSAQLVSASGASLGLIAPSSTGSVAPEPFQVLGVHRYDLSVSGAAGPYGTQVMVLFNRPNMPLNIPTGVPGFQAASALIQIEANQFWQKVMPQFSTSDPNPDDLAAAEAAVANDPEAAAGLADILNPPSPAALIQAFPRALSCYLEKPVGPYIPRTLTLDPSWTDSAGNPISGALQWPIQSGLLPGGAVVKGHFRKLDGTGVPGMLSYWYQQKVDNGTEIDLASLTSFVKEEQEFYYPLVTNNVATDPDGGFQLDFVPAPIGGFIGPFVLQGGFSGGTAFAQASILGNGQTLQMDLVLEGSGSVDGYVLDAQGQPIAGASLLACQEQRSSDFTQGTGGGKVTVPGSSDSLGHYHLDHLKAGVFSLQALKGDLGAATGGQITIDGQVVSLNVVIQGKVGTLKARVLDTKGLYRPDQAVRLGIPGGILRGASCTTWVYPMEQYPGADGWVTFQNVPAGDVQLFAPYSAPTPTPLWQGFLNPTQTQTVELKMVDPTQLATVKGYVSDAAGNPVNGAYLSFERSFGTFQGQTGADGFTAPIQVVPGSVLTGYVYHPNWIDITLTNSVLPQAGGSYVLSAVLPPRCALAGKVTRPDGTPVAGAYVAIPPVGPDNNLNRLCITDAQGHYSILNVNAGASYRVAAVGPELLTASNQQLAVQLSDTLLGLDFTLPAVGNNTLSGTVYQPLTGNQEDIPTNATLILSGQLPNVGAVSGGGLSGNPDWGLPMPVVLAGVHESDMPPSRIGQFSFPNLPAGPYTLSASSTLFPASLTQAGSFATTAATQTVQVHLLGNQVGALQGRVVQADGQTPVAAGARVIILSFVNGVQYPLLTNLTQGNGQYAFAKVIPPGSYTLRVEDPQSGNVVVQDFSLLNQEVKFLNLRLWGTGNLTVKVQDSFGQPMLCPGAVTCGTVTLQHSKAGLDAADMPVLALPLTPADAGSLVFPHLLEGQVSVLLKDPSGLSGMVSAVMPVGGGDQTVTVQLQPVGSIQGLLYRADGSLVPAGRIDAYQAGRWLGTSPTYQNNVQGQFQFNPVPTGPIQLEAWDPDSRQVGNATVQVNAGQMTQVNITTLDTGSVTVQVLQEGVPVIKAGLSVTYQGGPALTFNTLATADANGSASFILPPGSYAIQATDPVSLASGSMTFTRNLNDAPLAETVAIQPVRTLSVTALAPPLAPGTPAPNLAGWRVLANGLDRSVLLDSNGQGSLQEMPVGSYSLSLFDALGQNRGSQSCLVSSGGGAIQTARLTATAIGSLQVTVTDAGGTPLAGVLVTASNSVQGGGSLFSNSLGKALFPAVGQGTFAVSAQQGSQNAYGSYTLTSEGQMATTTLAFAPTGSLHGLVQDALGNPAPFVTVTLATPYPAPAGTVLVASATDGAGRYSFAGLPLQMPLTLGARTTFGQTAFAAPVTLAAAGDNPELDLTFSAMGSLSGQLSDPLRPLLPCLGISILTGSGQIVATGNTDETGAFQLPNLPAAQPLTLKAYWDDGSTLILQQTFTIAGQGQNATLNLAIPPFVNVAGWTLDVTGVNSPMITQLQDGSGKVLASTTTTGDLPSYFFRYLRAGQTFQLEGFDLATQAPLASLSFSPTGQNLEELHSLQAAPRPTLRLQLSYPDGSLAPGGSAAATLLGTGGLALGQTWSVVFDATGLALLPAMPPGDLLVTVTGLPWQGPLAIVATVPSQSADVLVKLPIVALATFRIQLLTNQPPGRAITQATVNYLRQGQIMAMPLQPDGSFQIQVPTGESLTVQVINAVLGRTFTQVFGQLAANAGTVTATIPVPALGSLSGRVLGAGGQLQAGIIVQLLDGNGLVQTTTSGPGGAFAFNRVQVATLLILVAQDPVIAPVSVQLSLTKDGDSLAQDLQLLGFATLTVHSTHSDGTDESGVPVTVTGFGVNLSGVSDSHGLTVFNQVQPNVDLSVAAAFSTGTLSAQTTLSSTQSRTLQLQESSQTLLSGRVRRQSDGQSWPAGASLVVASAASASVPLNPDGSFTAQTLAIGAGATLTFTVAIPGLRLPVDGYTAAIIGGATAIDLRAPAYGTLQGQVTLAGSPVAKAYVQLDGNQSLPTDLQGLTAIIPVLAGSHLLQVQVAASGGNPATMAWAEPVLQTDGQALSVALALTANQVSLPTTVRLDRLGFSVTLAANSCQWIPALSLGLDATAPTLLSTPPMGYWVIPGQSLAYEEDQGDIHLTRILSTAGYGVRDQLVFTNRGSVAHTVSLSALTGPLQATGADPALGTAQQTGGAYFSKTTLGWGLGAWVPTAMTTSGTYYWFYPSYPYYRTVLDTLLWPASPSLAPGQSTSIWLGYAPHGQSAAISSQGGQQIMVPATAAAANRALQRMVGQAPEWLAGLDPRISNQAPTATVTDVLPPWNGTAAFNLLDPTGQPVQAMGVPNTAVLLTPKELLAPVITVNLATTTRSFAFQLQNVPPDGFSYAAPFPTPLSGTLASGQILNLTLGAEWAVTQFLGDPNQPGSHPLAFGETPTWTSSDYLKAGASLRWTVATGPLAWSATEQNNSNLATTGTQALAPGAFTPIAIHFPAYGALEVKGLTLPLVAIGSARAYATGSGGTFAALPVGSQDIRYLWTNPDSSTGFWDYGTVQIQENVTATLSPAVGSLQITALDAYGVALSGWLTVSVANGTSTLVSGSYGPAILSGLPPGTYTVGLQDPASGVWVTTQATVSAGATTPVTLQLTQDGSLSATLTTQAGARIPYQWIKAVPSNGNTQNQSTGSLGAALFNNLGTGTASLTYGAVAGADPQDQPGSRPTVVALVPGAQVPVTLVVPNLGNVTVTGSTQAGDALSPYAFSIANQFLAGRRIGNAGAFQGLALGQPVAFRFGDGTGCYAPVDAAPVTPTVAGQTFNLVFPMGRLRVRVCRPDQSPLVSLQVNLALAGAAQPQLAMTDGTGVATFLYVPVGAALTCNATSAGALASVKATYAGPTDQLVDLVFPVANAQITAHLVRLNPQAPLGASGWTWTLTPGTDPQQTLPASVLNPVFTGLYPGSVQTVQAHHSRLDTLDGSADSSGGRATSDWTASASQVAGTASSDVTLTLPPQASARLLFLDANGHPLQGAIPGDSLRIVVKQSSNPGLSGFSGSLSFPSFDQAVLPEVFTAGTHVLGITSSLWGALPDVTFTVAPADDGTQLQLPVALNWIATPYALRAVAADGTTPVMGASFQVCSPFTLSNLPDLVPAAQDGIGSDTDAVTGLFYLPVGKQLQFNAWLSEVDYGLDGVGYPIGTASVAGSFHPAGTTVAETITLPLTAARARLTDTDGSDLGIFAVERTRSIDLPLHMVRIQGTAYATLLGDPPGPQSLILYDLASGLGQTASVTVPALGGTGMVQVALPPYAWLATASFHDVNGQEPMAPFQVGVSADSTGLVKPALAQWAFDPGNAWSWQFLDTWSLNLGRSLRYPPGSQMSAIGFVPRNIFCGNGITLSGAAMPQVRIPLQATLWMGACQSLDPDGNPLGSGPFASLAVTARPGEILSPAFQEPIRTWVNVPIQIQDGKGKPYPRGVLCLPAHVPSAWYYTGTVDGSSFWFDGSNPAALTLPQGEALVIQTAPPYGWPYGNYYSSWWFGSMPYTVPMPVPTDPILLVAPTFYPGFNNY